MRIILADDHVMIREGLRPFVERISPGTEVLEAGSLPEVLNLLNAGPVDLVILDLKMPGMNGYQGLVTLRQLFPKVQCVMLSAMADREHVLEAIRLGADGFIPKHLSGERFVPAILVDSAAGGGDHNAGELIGRLTPRERDILRLLREGHPNKVIANRLDVSEVTVKSHLGNVFRKLGVQNRLQAMKLLVDSEPF